MELLLELLEELGSGIEEPGPDLSGQRGLPQRLEVLQGAVGAQGGPKGGRLRVLQQDGFQPPQRRGDFQAPPVARQVHLQDLAARGQGGLEQVVAGAHVLQSQVPVAANRLGGGLRVAPFRDERRAQEEVLGASGLHVRVPHHRDLDSNRHLLAQFLQVLARDLPLLQPAFNGPVLGILLQQRFLALGRKELEVVFHGPSGQVSWHGLPAHLQRVLGGLFSQRKVEAVVPVVGQTAPLVGFSAGLAPGVEIQRLDGREIALTLPFLEGELPLAQLWEPFFQGKERTGSLQGLGDAGFKLWIGQLQPAHPLGVADEVAAVDPHQIANGPSVGLEPLNVEPAFGDQAQEVQVSARSLEGRGGAHGIQVVDFSPVGALGGALPRAGRQAGLPGRSFQGPILAPETVAQDGAEPMQHLPLHQHVRHVVDALQARSRLVPDHQEETAPPQVFAQVHGAVGRQGSRPPLGVAHHEDPPRWSQGPLQGRL